MTYNQFMNQQQQQQQQAYPSISSSPGAMFQPGFAGTNAQEVQFQNQQGGFSQSSPSLTYGFSNAGAFGGAQAMFHPGFAGTNAMEVRQNNAVFPQQQQFGGYSQFQQPMNQSSFSGQAGAGSIFSPGFAGTNIQEVQARNQPGNGGMGMAMGMSGFGPSGYSQQQNQGINSIFSPTFAGTNIQEVRQQNQASLASAPFQQGYNQFQQQAYRPQQQFQSFASPMGMGVQSVFNPGFAGTNAQEVRALNAAQSQPQVGSFYQGSI